MAALLYLIVAIVLQVAATIFAVAVGIMIESKKIQSSKLGLTLAIIFAALSFYFASQWGAG